MLVETRKYKQYSTEVNRLYFEQGVPVARIASQLPVSQPTICRGIAIFGVANPEKVDSMNQAKVLGAALAPGHQGLIHHRDRGVQYVSRNYVALLQAQGIAVSMTNSGAPKKNASTRP